MTNFFNRCPQTIDRPYPRWGESRFLQVGYRDDPLHVLWRPSDSRSQDGLLLVHGMNEYIGRYRHVAEHFGRHFNVLGVDLHAHGLTNPVLRRADREIATGAKTWRADDAFLQQLHLKTLENLRQDFRFALDSLQRRCDGHVFVLAHSLGGLVAASALLQENDGIRGILLLGPAFAVSRFPGWRGRLANPMMKTSFRLLEQCYMSHHSLVCLATSLMDGMMEALSRPGLRGLFSPCRPEWILDYLTDWEQERERLRKDCYMIPRVLMRYVRGVEKEIVHFRQRMQEFRLPYFLVYSEEDPITAPWGNRDFSASTLANHPHNAVMSLPGPYHEHLFMKPPVPQRILEAMDAWMQALMKKTKA